MPDHLGPIFKEVEDRVRADMCEALDTSDERYRILHRLNRIREATEPRGMIMAEMTLDEPWGPDRVHAGTVFAFAGADV